METGKILAAVLIKSPIGAKPDAKMTLKLLCMHRVNAAVILEDTARVRSMLQIAKDYVTWGQVSHEFAAAVLAKRGRLEGDKPLSEAQAKDAVKAISQGKNPKEIGVKRHLRLHPPTGGFKHTLKRPVSSKGETGDRKDAMQALLERMI